ncbi:uncharacterized protein LOC115888524 [Sitophilus oryzae]|uniref:Uncharacterized protein LOC115881429 n=1 Tax=Sitophilus oryzae TaxID=7048 RepID=A0A6J2XTB4_SITOR|nr:uncharacterized protein LOC115881429 [Sitophilus oryzae]XP_030764132.1 uncharacterized protein LOC115888524 [Sitophilus oryzae]
MERTFQKNPLKKRTVPVADSDRINQLAEPKHRVNLDEEFSRELIEKKPHIKYKASKRIQSLAKPKHVVPKKIDRDPTSDLSKSITKVSPSALTYQASRRIMELARPK